MISTSKFAAAVQFDPKRGDVEGNLRTAQQLTFEAAGKGARIIVLPELCVSGYAMTSPREASLCAQSSSGYQSQRFSEVARAHGCHIIFGYVEVYEGVLYNSAACIGPTGAVVANTRKHNLYGRDFLWASPGENLHPIVVTNEGRLGILVSRDVNNRYRTSHPFFKDGQSFYRRGSVDTIALSGNWNAAGGYPPADWVDLAESLGTNVIVSNRVGQDVEMKFIGGSCVIDRNLVVWTNGSSLVNEAVVGGVLL